MNRVLKGFCLNGLDDSSEITYAIGRAAYPTIIKLKDELVETYPKRNTSRLRKGIYKKELDTIRVLKELLRYYGMTLISSRSQTKHGCTYKYKIVN